MKKNYFTNNKACVAVLLVFAAMFATAQTTQTYSYTGSMQTFTVPSCVSQISVDIRGAQGANALDKLTTNSSGGLGGRSQGVIAVTPGQVLNIFIGGAGNTSGSGGYNGGGAGGLSTAGSGCNGGYAGGGGGASDIRLNGTALTDRIVVAGGGGGAGRDYCNGSCIPCGCGGSGGAGGGLTGVNGQAANNCGYSYPGNGTNYGGGGQTNTGGIAGPGDSGGPNGTSGVIGVGGDGGTGAYDVSGGGGGGGFYGGGGGGSASSGSGVGGGGGGGGSSYLGTLSSAATTPSFQTGNGLLVLSYIFNGGVVTATATSTLICSGSTTSLSAVGPVLSYTWSNGSNSSSQIVSPTTNTVYTVSSTNSIGCISTSSLAIVVNSGLPVLSINTSTNQTCLGKTVTLTATGANTYTWTNSVVNGVSFAPAVTTTYVVTGQNACGTATAATAVTVAPLPVSVISSPTTVCAGSPSTLTAVSGATSYSWMPVSFSGASLVVSPTVTTVYTVAVSDGTCAGGATVMINALQVPTVGLVASTTLVCANSPAYLTATGGLTYNWTPGNLSGPSVTVNPSAPTLYSVSATNALGCSTGSAVAIITNPSPTVNLVASTILICSGDPVDLIASGASSYQWSSGPSTSSIQVNPTSTTVYSVVGTDMGCTTTVTVEIAVFSPSLSVTGATAICGGQSALLTGNGGDTYNWVNNGSPFQSITVSPTVTTIYTLTALTATGNISCPSTLAYQLIVNPNPTVTTVANRTVMCKGESNTIAASGANSYSWSNGATTSSISITATLITTYNFTVTGTGANGCTSAVPVQLKVNACNGISELNGLGSALQIYPNPSVGEFNVQYDSELTLTLVNELGQHVKTIRLTEANNYKAHVSGLANGVYFITGLSNNQRIESKIIVNK